MTDADASRQVAGQITDEGLRQLQRRIGVEQVVVDPYLRYVNNDSIRHAARAIGDANPLWAQSTYGPGTRFGAQVAPPALLYGVAWGSWDMRRGEGLPGVHGLHSGDRWTYYRPLVAGDEVTATKMLLSLEEKTGRYAGRSVVQKRELRFFNQRNEMVARCQMSAFRTDRHSGRSAGKYASVRLASYSSSEIEQIDSEIEAEEVRGGRPRYWEDVNVGDQLQPVVRGPLTVSDMIAWAMGMGSPHIRAGQYWLAYRRRSPKVATVHVKTGVPETVERVHWDEQMAAEIGMPAPYDYGAQRGAWATHLMTNWAGDDGWVAEVDVQYRGVNFIGDTLRVGGSVSRKWRGKDGTPFVECIVQAISQRGEDLMPGRAVVALPSRHGPLKAFPIDWEAS
jgi:hypothetical protein